MINDIENYLETKIDNLTFGQIQDSPDSLINFGLYINNDGLFFNDKNTFTLYLTSFIRDEDYSNMLSIDESVFETLSNIYDINYENLHIVHIKKINSQPIERDDKNRYFVLSNYEILMERMEN